MVRYVVYRTDTGELISQGSTTQPDGLTDPSFLWPGQDVLIVESPVGRFTDWRVVDGALVERSAMAPAVSQASLAADGVDECVITGLPEGCTVSVQGCVDLPSTVVTDGTLTITTTRAGMMRVLVRHDPAWKPWQVVLNAA